MSSFASSVGIDRMGPSSVRRIAAGLGWILVIWIAIFFRLGYASFWDPDEAYYASASSEMLAAGDWFAPRYNDAPFFDKPILFYILQMLAFAVFGQNEFAARLVPALSAIGLIGSTAWFGAQLFDRRTGTLAALMLALLPATFALKAYAILDMTFVAFLFSGLALVVVAAIRGRHRLQYLGYALVGLAILTKGPLALVLAGLAFAGTLAIAPDIRRPLLSLRWITGLSMSVAISAPWFAYMIWRFGDAFIEGYFLRENLWLYSRPLFASTTSWVFFLRVTAVGLLPWTPLLIGRLVDMARGNRATSEERLLWAWAAAVVGFFTFSHFRLDHYVYAAAPALCLLAAREWNRLRSVERIAPHWGTAVGVAATPVVIVAAGVALGVLIHRAPLDLSPMVALVPLAFVVSGFVLLATLARRRFRTSFPTPIAGAILLTYLLALLFVLPQFEQAKPVKRLARELAAIATEHDAVAAYGMNRWNPSWRFYLRRHVRLLQSQAELHAFLQEPGRRFCLLLRDDYDALVGQGLSVAIVSERPGLLVTSGRALRRDRRSAWQTFVVASNREPASVRVHRSSRPAH